ncbi:alpha-amylase family protein [Gephyromycinifex aptenodytis]|uniref:alpha-amylase family protein n=1 Tax=Gephyromycinifex aptenodytis TaxID=2716227 RepID=UPI0014484E80|nr:alpha-amylase family protein [Gephyromycinifex aptenodytis]
MWIEHAIWWHVYPLGFVGAPIRDRDPQAPMVHSLAHLEAWLDYAVELGTSGLLLGPIFDSSTHGYDTTDYFRIDPRLGDEDDFDSLVRAAKQRGLRIVLDGVFNHVGRAHPAFIRTIEEGPSAPEADWFRLTWPEAWQPGQQPEYGDFEGHGDLIALNHDSPAVERLVGDVMRHWLARGVDGWRLDAAYAVDPAFWTRVIPGVRQEFPEAWFLGEVIHGDYAQIATTSGLDSITQYELWKATWSALADANFYELAHALTRHDEFAEGMLPQTFVGNHDVDRIATKVGGPKAVLAATVLFTVAGVPSVYYGDEQAYTGEKTVGWGGDDQVRPVFPATPSELSPLGSWMHRVYQDLIGMRRRHPWLVRARTEQVELSNERFVYRARNPEGPESITVELDVLRPSAQVTGADGQVLFRYDG